MKAVSLLFPHQLFQKNPLIKKGAKIYLIEEYLFFTQYKFHKQKIAFHRASMKCYEDYLKAKDCVVNYIDSNSKLHDVRYLIPALKEKGIEKINYIDTTDYWLNRRINESINQYNLQSTQIASPLFLNQPPELVAFFKPNAKKLFQTKFYKEQRKKRNILIDKNNNPAGGKWSFDADNRKKYPKTKEAPTINYPKPTPYHLEGINYTKNNFVKNYGELDKKIIYPIDFKQSKTWFKNFLKTRFSEFGAYEDAIVKEKCILHHSVITPMLNVGLLTPEYVTDEALKYAEKHGIPLNSLEGFIRQIIGWREFIRGVYECKGVEERTRNFWGFNRKIPASFYKGTTGINPVDSTIKKVLKSGYCHHIERLMILGNFMLLCEFDPDEVYKWFMELFIDAYDWVMVPNVYGMSQFADGGIMATKPYISGSNYLMKMSNYKKGEWQKIWDALFWRFMNVHRDFFLKNPRMGMLIKNFDKMDKSKQQHLMNTANNYLNTL